MTIKSSSLITRFEELPDTLPIFPLANAVFLPGGSLPLNVFEPRYLNMLHDAMRGNQLIGMIQPREPNNSAPQLFSVGCAGRVTRYEETKDGRLRIVLTGVCRFSIKQELSTSLGGYRLVVPDWSAYVHDFDSATALDEESKLLFTKALRCYFLNNKIEPDWEAINDLELNELATALISLLPLAPEDKQIIIETDTVANRITAFTAILESDANAASIRH